jgi:hypothetical protein
MLQPVLSLAFSMLIGSAPSAQIVQCSSASGEPYFTDHRCPPGEVMTRRRQPTNSLSIVESVPLTTGEKRRLAQLETPPKRRRSRSESIDERALCRAAQQGLRDLRSKRRRGYTAQEEADLEREERALKDQRRDAC